MRRHLAVVTILLMSCCFPASACSAQAESLQGNWVGGFWFNSHWVRLNVRFGAEQGKVAGAANVTFSSYEGAQGVNLTALRSEGSRLAFEIPLDSSNKVVFDGLLSGGAIKGAYKYMGSAGELGLTRVATVDPQRLASAYGLYRLSPGKVVSIGQDIDGPGALRYVDYETGQTAALWPTSENSFFSGNGLRVTYPVSLRVDLVRDARGAVTELTWKPAGTPAKRAQKIELKEEQLSWRSGEVTLGGTLITPDTAGPHPVIIIVPGDFGSSRDFLRFFAYNFLRRGVAALIFDSRGAGASTGPVNSSSFSDLADDVLAAVQLLKSKASVNPKQIGLFGFSNSAWTTALAASRSKDVAFLINQSMSGVPPWQQETFRAGAMLRSEGFPEEVVNQGVRFMNLKFETARTGEGWELLEAIRQKSGGERWFPFTNPPRSLERLRQSWRVAMTYDPVPSFEKITCPVLIVWGGKDMYIPVDESTRVFSGAMKRAGNRDYTIRILPTGSHSIFDAKTGSTTESSELKGFIPAYLDLVGDWLLRRVDVKR